LDRELKRNNTNICSRGVSIIEALLAAVVVGIGFVSVYTMATTATRMIYNSSQRDNDTLSISMIMDDLAIDRFALADSAYHDSISSSQYNNLNLTGTCNIDPNNVPAKKKDRQFKRWCNFLNMKKGGMGSPGASGSSSDKRKMYVRNVTLTSNGYIQKYKVIGLRIEHYSRNRNQKKYYRKILHE
jgi:Tfp pilus assembly protein PilV